MEEGRGQGQVQKVRTKFFPNKSKRGRGGTPEQVCTGEGVKLN